MTGRVSRWISILACAAACLTDVNCGRYSDFALPAPNAAGPRGPFVWQASQNPVIERADVSDVLNPSVVRYRGSYWNLYSSYDRHTWRTALATSPDGEQWTGRGIVLSPSGWEGSYIAANGSALVYEDRIWYWYEAGDPLRIGLATSTDGITWTKLPGPVIETRTSRQLR